MSPPVFPNDEDKTRAAHLLNVLLWSMTALLVVLILGAILGGSVRQNAIFVMLLMLFILLGLQLPMRRGYVRRTAGILIGCFTAGTIGFIGIQGTIRTPGITYLILATVMAGLLIGRRAAIVSTIVNCLLVVVLVFAEITNALPAPVLSISVTQGVAFVVSAVLTVVLLNLATHSIDESLARAHHELAERQKAEQTLRDSEARFKALVANSTDVITVLNADGTIAFESESVKFLLGYSPEEMLGKNAFDYIHPDDLAEAAAIFAEKIHQTGAKATVNYRFRRADGTWIYLESRATNLLDNPIIRGVVVNSRDVTEWVKAEQAIRLSETRYRGLVENLPDSAVILFDRDLRFVLVDGPETQKFGYSKQVMEGKTLYEALPETFAKLAEPNMRAVLEGKLFSAELPFENEFHSYQYVPIPNDQGEIVYGLILGQNITVRKRLEQDLRLTQFSVEHASIGIMRTGRDAQILSVNQYWCQVLGYTAEEICALHVYDIDPNFPLERWKSHREHIRQQGSDTFETVHRRCDGTLIPVEIMTTFIEFQGNEFSISFVRDVSERKLAEAALRRSEALLRALLDATTDIAFLLSTDYKFLTLNETMAQSLNTTVEDLVGHDAFAHLYPDIQVHRRTYFDTVAQSKQPVRWEDAGSLGTWWDNSVYPVFSPDGKIEAFAVYGRDISEQKRLAAELQRYNAQLEQMVEERTTQLRHAKEQIELILNNISDAIALAHPNGEIETSNPAFTSVFGDDVRNSLERILWTVTDDEQILSLSKALVGVIWERARYQTEAHVVTRDGGEKDLDLAFIPVQTAGDEERPGILLSAHDITHIKEIERFKARFVADALHDLATPITGLSTRLYLLRRSPEHLDQHVRALENQVEHLRNLLADLRTLSQLDRHQLVLNLEECSLIPIVTRVFDTYEPVTLSRNQTLTLNADPALPEVLADSRQIERVFVNLVSNAINYTPNGKAVILHLFAEGSEVVFRVVDEGIGITPSDLPHIFERFFRAEQARETQTDGTGLGLAIVKEIVEQHGGSVSAESEPGHGSTFTIRLPVAR